MFFYINLEIGFEMMFGFVFFFLMFFFLMTFLDRFLDLRTFSNFRLLDLLKDRLAKRFSIAD